MSHSRSNSSRSKGDDLERAVHAIESAILSASPSLSENTFRFESKKIVEKEGVRHEIDIWVEVELGKGYRSIFIFECKNWEEKVGKNEIIVFSEKIDAVQAQKGFFVAKSFSRYAEAQAAKDPRIQLLTVEELSVENVPVPFDLHFVIQEDAVPEVKLNCRTISTEAETQKFKASAAQAELGGQTIDFQEYLGGWMNEVCSERERTFPSGQLSEGTYELEARGERHFKPGELFVNQQDVADATLHVKFKIRLVRPPLVSHFEVATRGRALSLAPVQVQKDSWVQLSLSAIS